MGDDETTLEGPPYLSLTNQHKSKQVKMGKRSIQLVLVVINCESLVVAGPTLTFFVHEEHYKIVELYMN